MGDFCIFCCSVVHVLSILNKSLIHALHEIHLLSRYFFCFLCIIFFYEKGIFCRIVSDGSDFVCDERPPFVQTLALKLFCNQQPKPPKNERKMFPFVLFNQYIERRYPVWLNLKKSTNKPKFSSKNERLLSSHH